ncbi:pectin acetylesterase 8-like [Nicotiana tabacum]|uniref:Pectin acetylesterase n=1 Tax=Nicotiana tabacum TaxID=4097 RepID=A0A1S4BSK9_TOBAC
MAAIYAVLFVCVLSLCRTEALQTLLVNLTILESAVEKGAVCLDGSAPAFLFHRGTGFQYWLIHLEGSTKNLPSYLAPPIPSQVW